MTNQTKTTEPKTFTTTRDTGTGPVTVTVSVDYPVPTKGDVVNIYGTEFTVEDVTIAVDFDFDRAAHKYTGKVKMTDEPTPRVVFYIKPVGSAHFDFSWRKGEHFRKA